MTSKYDSLHHSPKLAGDELPTALRIINDECLVNKLTNKVILITGCSSGIGIETARALFATGATLYLTTRDIAKAKNALPEIITSDRVHLLKLDLDSLNSVRACAGDFLSQSKKLNIFIANAGIMVGPETRTENGFEMHIGTNHFGHFLLFNLLRETILASATPEFESRAIFVTSSGHRVAEPDFDNLQLEGAYNKWIAYGQSKTANIWTANEIDRRYGAKGLRAFSVHPGGVITRMSLSVTFDTPEEKLAQQEALSTVRVKTPEQGAATTVWASISKDLIGVGGKYLEDCKIARPWMEVDGNFGEGYGTWAYDAEKEGLLWKKSLELVGLKDEI